jgi:hypothetical protein
VTGTRGRACSGKKTHTKRSEAAAHRARLIALGAAAEGIRVYRCRHCGHFHVGHSGPTGRIHR